MHNGIYSVIVTQGNCTSVYSDGYEVMWVGIEEAFNEKDVKIYPTPSQGRFTLEINTLAPDVLKMKVYDAMNSAVYEEEGIMVDGLFKNQFDLGHLSNGMYFVVLEGENGNYLHKLVIRK